ncbi:hypothetical protein D3C81_1442220 [compost metagenome]
MAGAARIGNHLAAAVAARAGLLHREEALLHAHLADAAAGGAGDRRSARLGAAAAAGLAADQGRHADGHGGAAHRLFEIQLEGVAQVAAALRTATLTAAAAAEEVAEHVAEDVGEVGATGAEAGTATHARVDPGMPVLVVGRALAGVGEHLVGLVGLLELLLGRLVVGIAVRVILHGQATVGLLQLRLAGAALDPEHLVIVTFCHCFHALRICLPQTRQRGSKLPRGGSDPPQRLRQLGTEASVTLTCCP